MKLAANDLLHHPMIEPSSVLAYLRGGAWVKLDEHRLDGRHVVTLFEHPRREVEVHVPVWPNARDYPRLLAHAINEIALAEGRPTLAVLSDLQAAGSDQLRIGLGDATLSLTRATAVLHAVRTLSRIAASSLGYPLPSRQDALLDQITVGLAEPGAAAVRVLVPVSSETAASAEALSVAAEAGPRPWGRRITEALATMVATARQAAEAAAVDGTIEAFTDRGVSAEVCGALASAGAPLTIELGWALTMPRAPVEAIVLSAELIATLAEAAQRLPEISRR